MGVLSVSSLFLTRVGVYVGVGVCIRTHTYILHTGMGYSGESPGVRMGPKNADALDLGIYIFVYVYKVHMCMYMLANYFFSLTYFFFWQRKAKDVNANRQ